MTGVFRDRLALAIFAGIVTTALLGGRVGVPTAKGKAMLNVPAGTQPGDVLRMAGLGVPRSGGGAGDELVAVEVQVPKDLTPEQREIVEKLRDELDASDA